MLNASIMIQPNNLNLQIVNFEDKQKLLKHYTYFQLNQVIGVDEGIEIEFKDFRDPLSLTNMRTLNRVICGFLNQEGGRIYIGIEDQYHKVKGVYLSLKQRDEIKLEIDQLTKKYEPSVKSQDIQVMYIPVQGYWRTFIRDLYVIKIIVKQGDPRELYFDIDGYSYMRRDGSVQQLTPTLFKKNIIERQKKELLPNWEEERNKKFNDPLPDEFILQGSYNQPLQQLITYIPKQLQYTKQILPSILEEKQSPQQLQQIIQAENIEQKINILEESKHQQNIENNFLPLSASSKYEGSKQDSLNYNDDSQQNCNINNIEQILDQILEYPIKIQFLPKKLDLIQKNLAELEQEFEVNNIEYSVSQENKTIKFGFDSKNKQNLAQKLLQSYIKELNFKIIE